MNLFSFSICQRSCLITLSIVDVIKWIVTCSKNIRLKNLLLLVMGLSYAVYTLGYLLVNRQYIKEFSMPRYVDSTHLYSQLETTLDVGLMSNTTNHIPEYHSLETSQTAITSGRIVRFESTAITVPTFTLKTITIAITGGITSSKISANLTRGDIQKKFPLFNTFLPSFCLTCSAGFSYHFYFVYDYTDPFFTNSTQLHIFIQIFEEIIAKDCLKTILTKLHLIQCDHTKHPAWAQNDAVMAAYLDNMDYFYRLVFFDFFNGYYPSSKQ